MTLCGFIFLIVSLIVFEKTDATCPNGHEEGTGKCTEDGMYEFCSPDGADGMGSCLEPMVCGMSENDPNMPTCLPPSRDGQDCYDDYGELKYKDGYGACMALGGDGSMYYEFCEDGQYWMGNCIGSDTCGLAPPDYQLPTCLPPEREVCDEEGCGACAGMWGDGTDIYTECIGGYWKYKNCTAGVECQPDIEGGCTVTCMTAA